MITKDEIRSLSRLARIELTDAEVEAFSRDFGSILGYVEQISQVDVSGVELGHAETNVARDDADPYPEGRAVDAMLADAPDSGHGFYKVPKILS